MNAESTLRRLVTLVAAVLLAACSPNASPAPAASGQPATKTQPSSRAPSSDALAATALPPLVDVPFYRGNVTANSIDPGPGPAGKPELAWRVNIGPMHMVPILVNGLLIVGTNDGKLVALDAHTGEQRWSFQAKGTIQPTLGAAEGLVYASDGTAYYAIDVGTGMQRWSAPIEGASGRVIVVDGVAYLGHTGGVLGFDAQTGKQVWRWHGLPDVSVNAGPIVDGVGFFAARNGRVYAIDTKTGHEVWNVQTISNDVASGQVVGDTVYISNNQGDGADPAGEIYAINRASGKVRWRFRTPSGLQIKEGPIKDGILYANGRADGLYALRDQGSSAQVVWHVDAPESHWPMAMVGDTLYQARIDGSVGAYAAGDGKLLWQTTPDGEWANGPVVSGGMVFVDNDKTGVMAFADPSLIALLPTSVAQATPAPTSAPQLPNPYAKVRTVASLEALGLSQPVGMDVGADAHLYILDSTSKIQVVNTKTGAVVRSIGRRGSGPGELSIQTDQNGNIIGDLAVAPYGDIYVADSGNHRVDIFSESGESKGQFGTFGQGDGQFSRPLQIAVDSSGSVYVTDADLRTIQKFDSNSRELWSAGGNTAQDAMLRIAELHGILPRGDGTLLVFAGYPDGTTLPPYAAYVVDAGSGKVVGTWGVMGHARGQIDGYGEATVDGAGNLSIFAIGIADGLQMFAPDGTFIGGAYSEPGQRVAGRETPYWPPPVFAPGGAAYAFAADGLVELKVTQPKA